MRHVNLQCLLGRCRRMVAPQRLNQPVVRHDLVRLQEQCCQKEPLLCASAGDWVAVLTDLERAEDAEVHFCASPPVDPIRGGDAALLYPLLTGALPPGSIVLTSDHPTAREEPSMSKIVATISVLMLAFATAASAQPTQDYRSPDARGAALQQDYRSPDAHSSRAGWASRICVPPMRARAATSSQLCATSARAPRVPPRRATRPWR